MKIVKTAVVEPIKSRDLQVGDYILWSNFRCKVVQIVPKIRILQFEKDKDSVMTIPKYIKFYRILEHESIIVCNCCFENEVQEEGQWCKECISMHEGGEENEDKNNS